MVLWGTKKKLIKKNTKIKITHILYGIGALLCQYFSGLSKSFNFINKFFVIKINIKDNKIDAKNVIIKFVIIKINFKYKTYYFQTFFQNKYLKLF